MKAKIPYGESEIRVLSPTAILGYGFPEASFYNGLEKKPHVIAVDAGSTDPGPYYLGKGKSFTDREFVKRDLKYMFRAANQLNIPLIIGTAGGSGALPHLKWCYDIIQEIISEEKITLTLGIIPTDVDKNIVQRALRNGKITNLDCVHPLNESLINETNYIVAQIGIQPIIKALKLGCDVVLVGRCYDPAVFAAVPIMCGFDEGLSIHMGKILECAAIAATPGSGADCAMGIIKKYSFLLEALNPKRKFTPESSAAHTLYEKSDPYHLPGPEGMLDLTECSFTQVADGIVEVKGSKFIKDNALKIKLEGAKQIGYRTISIAGVRDPIMISRIDSILNDVKKQVFEITKLDSNKHMIFFHVYGKNGVMGQLEPLTDPTSHELCIIIDVVAPTQESANTLCSVTRSTLLHFGYDGRISTAGNLAFPFSPSDVSMGEVYEFSIYHLIEIDNYDIFKIFTQKFENGVPLERIVL